MQTSLEPLKPALKRSRPYNIFALPAGFSGCAFWRYRLPLNKLKKLGTHLDINIADNPNKLIRFQDVQRHVESADLITIQAPGNQDALTLMKMYKIENKKIVIDFDDHSFDLSPGNPRFSELGCREADILDDKGNKIFNWRNGENGFDLEANRKKYEAFLSCVKLADGVTTTTEYLAEKFRKHNPNVFICPNSIDFDLWRPVLRPQIHEDTIRIGWFGGDSHYIDLKMFKSVLPRVVRKYPQAHFVFQAPPMPQWLEFFKSAPPENLEWHNWVDLRYYTLFLASLNFDIGLCPLEDNDFNRSKSNIKFLEFAALGAAVVAQNIIPYANTIAHGKTGLLAGTEEEWFEQISLLIEDNRLRNTIAMNGYTYAKENFDLSKNCRIWEKVYTSILTGGGHVGFPGNNDFRVRG